MNNQKNNYSESSVSHNQWINIECMTPEEYIDQGINLEIHYSFVDCPFGKLIVASTQKGICSLSFAHDETLAVTNLKNSFPKASFIEETNALHQNALSVFSQEWSQIHPITLHLKGTDFQIEVWKALLEIPWGKLVNYGDIAKRINHPKAYRAVGSAVGKNPIFFLIPCHRVIQASGNLGNYYWGRKMKSNIIKWESDDLKIG